MTSKNDAFEAIPREKLMPNDANDGMTPIRKRQSTEWMTPAQENVNQSYSPKRMHFGLITRKEREIKQRKNDLHDQGESV